MPCFAFSVPKGGNFNPKELKVTLVFVKSLTSFMIENTKLFCFVAELLVCKLMAILQYP